ncbi:uncharacterized protein LOC114406061 isoform X2 [Glycine soja]|uniref:uncharacterized protein LOC114406061 isoform X2 n=1 Tax=Glycine soja TaxID=3848 RepID=UPI00103E1525|nr:uncharacterized protein LOC114406061 isoform X2 [Glycine soja]
MEMSVARLKKDEIQRLKKEIAVLLLETYVPGFRSPLWCLPRHQPRRGRGGPSFNTMSLLLPRVSLNQFLWPLEAPISSGTMAFSCSCSPPRFWVAAEICPFLWKSSCPFNPCVASLSISLGLNCNWYPVVQQCQELFA